MLLLLGAIGIRALGLGQPIVENYVGRQIPTAMVARNLERGSGFFRPSLDVAPPPNLFLVEPPVYAAVTVAFRRLTGIPLEGSGRLVSAFGIALGAWGLYGLSARRSGRGVGLLAAGLFAIWPVTIRYGRAFQPDALMIGAIVAGLNGWERGQGKGRQGWLPGAMGLLATGLALKVLSVYILAPLLLVLSGGAKRRQTGLALLAVAPALAWYVYAWSIPGSSGGSRASADNGAIWLRALDPSALFRGETLWLILRFPGARSFTPLGLPLAVLGLFLSRSGRRFWLVWGASALGAMAAVAPKLHHEYYWLSLAPIVSFGAAEALMVLSARSQGGAVLTGALVVGLSAVFSANTWRTPAEWSSLPVAGRVVQVLVPESARLAAPEALLYVSDRKGCRVEFSEAGARRAAGEWGERAGTGAVRSPADLVAFYEKMGARYFADVAPPDASEERLTLHRAIRGRYNVIWDRDGVLVANLSRTPDGASPSDGRERR